MGERSAGGGLVGESHGPIPRTRPALPHQEHGSPGHLEDSAEIQQVKSSLATRYLLPDSSRIQNSGRGRGRVGYGMTVNR